MAHAPLTAVLRHVRSLLDARQPALPDTQLLERFIQGKEEAAFVALMHRYGPLVIGVARRVLRHEQDAEDVFQATFLILAHNARSVRKRSSVGSWLYGVAYRLALKTRAASAREKVHQPSARPPYAADDPAAEVSWRELRQVVDEELARLPERYRAPLVLCYFDGQTQDEAARQLGWKPRTLRARLDRGRKLLRNRLARRGLALSAALAGPLLAPGDGVAALPLALMEATSRAARLLVTRQTMAGTVSEQAIALAKAGLHTMFLTRLQMLACVLLTLALIAGGAGLLARSTASMPVEEAEQASAGDQGQPHVDAYGDPLPAGAALRLGTVRFRFGGNGWTPGFSFLPDSSTIIAAPGQNGVQVWEARTGRLLRTISTGDSVHGFGLAPDGKRFAVSVEAHQLPASIRVFEVASGKELQRFPRDSREVNDCTPQFTPDGKLLMSPGPNTGVFRIEEIASGTEILREQFPADNEPVFAVSPDGATVAVTPGPNRVKLYLWNWQGGEKPREVRLGDFVPMHLVFTPDGKMLAGSSSHDDTIRFWDVASGRVQDNLNPPGGGSSYSRFAFSADGRYMAVTDAGDNNHWSGKVRIWDLHRRAVVRELAAPGENIRVVSISPDLRWVAAANSGGFHVWDLQSGEEVGANSASHRADVTKLTVSPKGLIASAGDDHTVRLWDAGSGKQRALLQHGGWVRAVAFSPDGALLASSGLDDTVRLWDTATYREIYKLAGHGQVGGTRSLAFTPDGRRLLSYGDDFYLRTWDVRTGKAVSEKALRPGDQKMSEEDRPQLPFEDVPRGALLSPDSGTLVVPSSSGLCFFDTGSGRELRKIQTPRLLISGNMDISPDSKRVLVYSFGDSIRANQADGQGKSRSVPTNPVHLWDLTSGKLLLDFGIPGKGAGPVKFSTDGKLFATTSYNPDGKIQVWNAATGKLLWSASQNGVAVSCVAFTPDGKRLLSAMRDTSILVWDLPPLE